MKKSLLALALLLFGLTIACAPPYRQAFNDAGKEKGWTTKQTNAAFAYADRTFWSREVGENKYIIVYGKIPTSKVREQLEGVLKDLDGGLDPKNAEMSQYLATFNLRKDMTHDEEIAEAIFDRIRAAELEAEFQAKMGVTPETGPEAEIAKGYSAKKIYIAKKLVDAFPFKSEQIEAAKKAGLLKPIEHAELNLDLTYDHKAADPLHPDDENEFVWKGKKQAVVLTNYKIIDVEKPQDNHGNYIEGYRILDGKKESSPAIKVFFPEGGDSAVLLVDTDEEGQPGFGVPNLIEEIDSLTHVSDLISNDELLDALFTKKDLKKDRVVSENKLFKIEIAKLGAPVDEWVKAPTADGWIVPFPYTDAKGDNYNVRVHFAKPKMADMTEGHPHSEYAMIEYIEKEFTKTGERWTASAGQVIEYYKPRADYAGKLKAEVLFADSTKKISFQFEDGSVVEGFVTPGKNKFVEDSPYAKSYTEGQKRYWIQKSPDSAVFDKRKIVGKPKEVTGSYYNDTMEEQFRSLAVRPGDHEMDMKKEPKQ